MTRPARDRGAPWLPALVMRSLFLRPMLRRPGRFLVTVAGVAIGVASVVATVASNRAAVSSFREGVEEVAGRTRLEVTRPGGLDEGALGSLRGLASDAAIVPVIEELAIAPALGDAVRVLGVDLLADRSVRDLDLASRAPLDAALLQRALRGEGALVPDALAREAGVAAGGSLRILVRSRPVDLPVIATLRPRAAASAWDRVVVVDVAWAQELFGRVGRLDRIELLPREGVDVEALAGEVRRRLPEGCEVAAPRERGERTGRMLAALEFNLTALSGISLLVGAVLVGTTLATSVVQRRSILALLRSLGTTRQQIAASILLEAAAIGLLGGLLGVAAGALGARAMLASVRSTMAAVVQGIPETELAVPAGLAIAGVLAGVLVSLAAALLPLREALATPAVQGLRAERPRRLGAKGWRRAGLAFAALVAAAVALAFAPAVAGLPIPALFSALAVLALGIVVASPVLDLAARAAARASFGGLRTPIRIVMAALSAGRRRAAWASGALGVAVALAVAIAVMVGSFRTTVAEFLAQTIRSDVWVRPVVAATGVHVGRLDPEIVTTALALFGPDVVDPFHESTARIAGEDVALAAGEFAVVRRAGGVPFVDGRDSREVFTAALRDRSAIVNESLARRFGVGRGDVLRLETRAGILERRIEGVFYDYSRSQGLVVLDRGDFLAHYPDEGPQQIALFLPPGADAEAAQARLRTALGGRFRVDVLLNRELRREAMATFDRTFAITTALQLVSSLVAVIAVLTVLGALVDERRKDLALLRALGGSRFQVAGVVVGEAGVLGLLGVVSGVVLGLATGLVIVKVVNLQSFGWSLRFLPPWGDLAATVGAVVPACLMAGLVPAIAAARFTPQELFRDDA